MLSTGRNPVKSQKIRLQGRGKGTYSVSKYCKWELERSSSGADRRIRHDGIQEQGQKLGVNTSSGYLQQREPCASGDTNYRQQLTILSLPWCAETLAGKKNEEQTPQVVFHTDQGPAFSSQAFCQAHEHYTCFALCRKWELPQIMQKLKH